MDDHSINSQLEYASFLVRLWRVSDPDSQAAEWQSEVKHIQSGQMWTFDKVTNLMEFLNKKVAGLQAARLALDDLDDHRDGEESE